MYFIYAICAKITKRFELANEVYGKLKEGIRLSMNKKMANTTCSILLLPIEKSRTNFIRRIFDFVELINFLNQDELVDKAVYRNFKHINTLEGDRK
jgi:hypothetical protein